MCKKHIMSLIFALLLCMTVALDVKAGAYNAIVTDFNPLTWQLSASAVTIVDYSTRLDYNPNIKVMIRLGSANGQIISSSPIIYAGPGSDRAEASTSTFAQADTTYFVTCEHVLECQYFLAGYGWIDSLGYIPLEPALFTYRGAEFTVNPTNVSYIIPNTPFIYLGNTNRTYTTPAYDGLAAIDGVGFKGDIGLYNWATHTSPSPTQYDPGDQGSPIWVAGDPTERTAVYTYSGTGSVMILTARIVLGRVPPANSRANIRVKAGSTGPIVAGINNVPVTYPVLTINNLPGNLGAVPNYNGALIIVSATGTRSEDQMLSPLFVL